MKKSEIKFTVSMDVEQVPEVIEWEATDSGMEGKRACKATLLSLWDPKENTTLRIDLWTKEMPVDDMKRFFYENFASMADTYIRATNDEAGATSIRQFADQFAFASGLKGEKK
jgi:gliding motility-associated protein GldC